MGEISKTFGRSLLEAKYSLEQDDFLSSETAAVSGVLHIKSAVDVSAIMEVESANIVIVSQPSGSAELDWQERISGPGVVWSTDFRTDAEVDAFRWSGGLGNDPNDIVAPGTIIRQPADGVKGMGCMEAFRPAGTAEGAAWWRPFAPIRAPGTGKATDDQAANGTVTLRDWDFNDPDELAEFTFGWYGHPDTADANFDGHDFWIQLRVKVDPRRITGGNENFSGGKLIWFTTAETAHSLSNGEHVTLGYGTNGNQGVGHNYFRLYAFQTVGIGPFDPLDQEEPGSRIQPGSEVAEDWFYSGGWDTILYHLRLGKVGVTSGPDSNKLEVFAAHEGEANYTRIWRQEYGTSTFEARDGLQALRLSSYHNGFNMQEFWQRWDEVIFSKEFIPIPGITQSVLGTTARSLLTGQSADLTANTTWRHPGDIQWQLRTVFYDRIKRQLHVMGKPASSQAPSVYSHYIYDEATDSWTRVATDMFNLAQFGHIWCITFDEDRGELYALNSNGTQPWRFRDGAWEALASGSNVSGQSIAGGGLGAQIFGFHPHLFGDRRPGLYVQSAFRGFALDTETNTWHLLMTTSFPDTDPLRDRNNGQCVYIPALQALKFWSSGNRPANGFNAGIIHKGAGASTDAFAAGLITSGTLPPILIRGGGGDENHGHVVPHPDDPNKLLILEEHGTARVWESVDFGVTWNLTNYNHPFDGMLSENDGEFATGTIPQHHVMTAITSSSTGGVFRIWKPNAAPAWFESLEHLEWAAPVSNWLGDSAVKDPLADTTNHGSSGVGHASIITAWTGMLVDAGRRTVAMLANGGHADYWGNEVYSLDLSVETPAWIRRRNATPHEGSSGNIFEWSDGTPSPTHSNNTQVAANGRWFMLGMTAAPYEGGSDESRCWEYDPVAEDWISHGSVGIGSTSFGLAAMFYPQGPGGGLLIRASQDYTAYQTINNPGVLFEQGGGTSGNGSAIMGDVDTVNHVMLTVQLSGINNYRWRKLDSTAARTGASNILTASGTPPTVDGAGRWNICYHAPSQSFITWAGGQTIKRLVPTVDSNGNYIALTWVDVPGTSGVIPQLGDSKLYGKIQLIPDMGNGDAALVIVPRYAFPDVYVCRIKKGLL